MDQTSDRLQIESCASAYCWPDKILVHAYAQTEAGFYVHAEPWVTLQIDVLPTVLGAVLRKLMLAFRSCVPVPDYRSDAWKALRLAKLRAVGVRSDRQFMRSSRHVWIERDAKTLAFVPHRNGGSTGPDRGYHNLYDKAVKASTQIDNETVGRKLLEAWRLCS